MIITVIIETEQVFDFTPRSENHFSFSLLVFNSRTGTTRRKWRVSRRVHPESPVFIGTDGGRHKKIPPAEVSHRGD
tara:strand:+ start:1072 stop:1299 length:228 start_codon:yes stop_codon:yes gene_type:complete